MNCRNCGAPLTDLDYCSNCGTQVLVQKKAYYLSNLYYNQGLEKASIRDLSGAISCLKRSLIFNKLNIQARNLLGLVYFETGEVVSALSEWVISKNLRPVNNLAEGYINQLQENQAKLDTINESIHKYNEALADCHRGNEDVAAIQLKKVLNQNPKLIKGYHLLALLQMKDGAYNRARKTLKKAIRIDKTNTTTLRFLRDVDEQTGVITNLEPKGRKSREDPVDTALADHTSVYQAGNDIVVQPPEFREKSMFGTLLNLGIGLAVGAAAIWFLAVPAMKQKINQEANDKIIQYSTDASAQEAQVGQMESDVGKYETQLQAAKTQIDKANEQASNYDSLLKAYQNFQAGNQEEALTALKLVKQGLLSENAKEIYNTVKSNLNLSDEDLQELERQQEQGDTGEGGEPEEGGQSEEGSQGNGEDFLGGAEDTGGGAGEGGYENTGEDGQEDGQGTSGEEDDGTGGY